MPASLPGETKTNNLANPSAGNPVIFDLLSGPMASPLDVRKINLTTPTPTYTADGANQNPSTGALSTGIGFGSEVLIGLTPLRSTPPLAISGSGFTDDYTPGVTKPDGTASADSRLMYIGGGKSSIVAGTGANGNGYPASYRVSSPVPYTAGFGIGSAGNGGSRDAGAGPAFTGFLSKMVTAAGAVANGAAVETGFINRTGVALVANQSTFGSSNAASAAPA